MPWAHGNKAELESIIQAGWREIAAGMPNFDIIDPDFNDLRDIDNISRKVDRGFDWSVLDSFIESGFDIIPIGGGGVTVTIEDIAPRTSKFLHFTWTTDTIEVVAMLVDIDQEEEAIAWLRDVKHTLLIATMSTDSSDQTDGP